MKIVIKQQTNLIFLTLDGITFSVTFLQICQKIYWIQIRQFQSISHNANSTV
jgi:hypothetical protein